MPGGECDFRRYRDRDGCRWGRQWPSVGVSLRRPDAICPEALEPKQIRVERPAESDIDVRHVQRAVAKSDRVDEPVVAVEQAVEGGRVRDVRTLDEVARAVHVSAAAGIHPVKEVAAWGWIVYAVNRRLEDLLDVAIEKIRVSEITGV